MKLFIFATLIPLQNYYYSIFFIIKIISERAWSENLTWNWYRIILLHVYKSFNSIETRVEQRKLDKILYFCLAQQLYYFNFAYERFFYFITFTKNKIRFFSRNSHDRLKIQQNTVKSIKYIYVSWYFRQIWMVHFVVCILMKNWNIDF